MSKSEIGCHTICIICKKIFWSEDRTSICSTACNKKWYEELEEYEN